MFHPQHTQDPSNSSVPVFPTAQGAIPHVVGSSGYRVLSYRPTGQLRGSTKEVVAVLSTSPLFVVLGVPLQYNVDGKINQARTALGGEMKTEINRVEMYVV